MRKNKIAYSIQLTAYSGILLLLCYSLACAEEQAPKAPIVVNGDKVEYYHDEKKVVGTGNISITYQDVVLTCDRVTVYMDTREAIAEGNVRITQKDAYFTGERMNYNFDTRKGKAIDGYFEYRPFYGRAPELDKIAMKDQFNLERGYATTCNMDKPHYRIQSRKVKIYMGDRVEAWHVLLFLGNAPIFYFPYYCQPLDQPKTHMTVTTGKTDEWGYYALTATRYNADNYNKGDMLIDYRNKKGLGVGINHYYDTRRVGRGALKFYYTHENDSLARTRYSDEMEGPAGDMKPRYRWQARHKWNMAPDAPAVFTLAFNRLSDRDVIKDYFYNEHEEEEGDEQDTYLSFVTGGDGFSTQLLARKRFGKMYTVLEKLPEYSINIPDNNIIPGLPVYYSATGSAAYLNKTFDNSNTPTVDSGQRDVSVTRIDVYNKFSYAAKFLGSLALTPYAGIRDTYYSTNIWGKANQIRNIFDSGIEGSIKFYKVYDVKTNFLDLDINKIRHIITPTAKYYNAHQPSIGSENLKQLDEIDAMGATNGAIFAVENKLQTKRLEGEQLKSVDLATCSVSTNYTFRLKKGNLAYKNHTAKFQSVDLWLELNPYPWMYSRMEMSINTKNLAVRTETIDVVADYGNLSLGIGQRYEKVETGPNNHMTFEASYKLNEKWSLRTYGRFNVDKSFEMVEATVFRDLHCWRAQLTCSTTKHPPDVSIWFLMTLKAFPEYPIGFMRSYSSPSFGSNARNRLEKRGTVGKGEEKMIPHDRWMLP